MKKFIIINLMLCVSMAMMALPAKRKPITITQSDGSKITVILRGDETFHYYIDTEGDKLVKDKDGMFRKASKSEAKAMSEKWTKKLKARNASHLRKAKKIKRMATASGVTGTKKGLVILVNFQDVSMKTTSTQSAFNDMFNKEGYNKNYHIGSVRDYFKDQSYGKLTIDFDVVGPYKVSHNMSYYGKNVDEYGNEDEYYGNDQYPATMVSEACKLANADVNFKDYDWDGDGVVDQIYVIYAGYSEASDASSNTIWPHSWSLAEAKEFGDGSGALTLDGVKVDTYACSSELWGSSGSRIDGIGSAVHEFSHCMGLPDFYDTGNEGNFGMDSWSVMDYGCYNGPYYSETEDYQGNVPAGYTAYERMFSGWLTPTELSSACLVNGMKPITQEAEAYIIYNDANKNEFYMLENHQNESWDKYAYGHGMLVVHVDYDEDAWYDNVVNNSSNHQRCTIIPADNQFQSGYDYNYGYYATDKDLAGDPYPGTSGNTALTDSSTPKAALYNKNASGNKLMGKPIEDIAESKDGLISFKFMGGIYVESPVAEDATAVSLSGFTANWTAVEGVKDYTLELVSQDKDTPEPVETRLLFEDFSKMKNSAESAEVTEKNEAEKMTETGWYFSKVFECVGKIRLGSGKAGSEFATPYLNTTSGTVIVRFKEGAYKSDHTTIGVWILDENDSDVACQEVEITGTSSNMVEHTLVFENVPETFCVDFYVSTANHRYYLDDVEVISVNVNDNKETKTFTGITDTNYVFSDLDSSKVYTYRVIANTDEASSAWSNSITVELSAGIPEDVNQDGIVNSLDVLKVYKFMQTSTGDASGLIEDVNRDGDVNSLDVLKIYKYMQSH